VFPGASGSPVIAGQGIAEDTKIRCALHVVMSAE
ncbi:uncharacterized protein METZ01_LOCUS320430, partial [marine metagenome]